MLIAQLFNEKNTNIFSNYGIFRYLDDTGWATKNRPDVIYIRRRISNVIVFTVFEKKISPFTNSASDYRIKI